MKLSIELENIIRKSSTDTPISSASQIQQRQTLSDHLLSIEARKALEVEHYLRACSLRLDLPCNTAHNG